MGRPIIPVPGMPTPMAFLIMLPLRRSSIFSGKVPKTSVALATQSETAAGSVQPIAGTTSRLMRSIMRFLSDWFIMVIFMFF